MGSSPIPATIRPVGQAVKTRPFHGCNMGSIPVRVTTKKKDTNLVSFFFCVPRMRDPIHHRTACRSGLGSQIWRKDVPCLHRNSSANLARVSEPSRTPKGVLLFCVPRMRDLTYLFAKDGVLNVKTAKAIKSQEGSRGFPLFWLICCSSRWWWAAQ